VINKPEKLSKNKNNSSTKKFLVLLRISILALNISVYMGL